MTGPTPTIVYKDDDILVLDKPARLSTTAPGDEPSLVRIAATLDPRAPHLHPTSRLDAEVTGLVTFARTSVGNHHLLEARKRGQYQRLYVGLAMGRPEPIVGSWTSAIAIHGRDRRFRCAVPEGTPGAKRARTDYEVGPVAGPLTWLWLMPRTGRTHQLRVHAAHAGVPLFGDRFYGGVPRVTQFDGSVVAARRTMLHCRSVQIPSMWGGAPLRLDAPLHGDMAKIWEALGGDSAALEISRVPERWPRESRPPSSPPSLPPAPR
ncbi:MAG: RluA family pseudouridine synthase [Myxococcales bacterium]|nr:RluA family pseudouridine synthase [Myxococcales bacterium]